MNAKLKQLIHSHDESNNHLAMSLLPLTDYSVNDVVYYILNSWSIWSLSYDYRSEIFLNDYACSFLGLTFQLKPCTDLNVDTPKERLSNGITLEVLDREGFDSYFVFNTSDHSESQVVKFKDFINENLIKSIGA